MANRERQSERHANADLIPESAVGRVAAERLIETELALVTDRLAQVPELRRDPRRQG
jgi:hypothetical protein